SPFTQICRCVRRIRFAKKGNPVVQTFASMEYVSRAEDRTPSQKAFHRGQIHEIKGWRKWLLFLPAATAIRIYYATLRFDFIPEELEKARAHQGAMVMMAWHNRSLLMPGVLRLVRPADRMKILVSASKMAAWEAALFEWMGYGCVRGSTTRRSI